MRRSLFFISVAILSNFSSIAQIVTTIAGDGSCGNANGTGTLASFCGPSNTAIDNSGNIFVADNSNHLIRKITPSGVVSTFAGSGIAGNTDATGTAASFDYPWGLVLDASGNLYVGDQGNHKIRKITPLGVVSTFAGSSSFGNANGTGTLSSFNYPSGLSIDAVGNIIVADCGNHLIRKISPLGVVTTIAGSGMVGNTDATGTSASFNYPISVAIDLSGNIFVADQYNHKIRKISSTGVVTTIAGNGFQGSIDATGVAASFNNPQGVCVDAPGNLYIADSFNHKIRKISPFGAVSTYAGTGVQGSTDGPIASVTFKYLLGLSFDQSGNILYISDSANHKIRKIGIATSIDNYGSNFDDSEVLLYPNPGKEIINIEFNKNNLDEDTNIEVINSLGQIIQTINVRQPSNKLNIEDYRAGIYLLKTKIKKQTKVLKFVKE